MSCLLPWRTNRQPFLRANRSNSLQVISPTVTNIAQKCDMAKLILPQYSSHDLTLGGINLNFSQIENKVCSGKDVVFSKSEILSTVGQAHKKGSLGRYLKGSNQVALRGLSSLRNEFPATIPLQRYKLCFILQDYLPQFMFRPAKALGLMWRHGSSRRGMNVTERL